MREYFLPRISQNFPYNTTPAVYQYVPNAGKGVNAFILDTGVYFGHSEFTGRIIRSKSFVGGQSTDDLHGHWNMGRLKLESRYFNKL